LRPPMVLKTAPEATQTSMPPTIPPAASRYVASAAGRSSPADTLAAQPLAPSPPRILALEEGPLRPPVVLKTTPEATQTSMPPTIPPAASRNVASAAGGPSPTAALAAQPPTPSPPRILVLVEGTLRPPVVSKANPRSARTMPPLIPASASRNVASAKGRTAQAALVAQPLEPPEPPPIREEVQGNLYVNHTYSFRMYKPPSWQVIEGAQTALPSAI